MNEDFEWDDYEATVDHDSGNEDSYLDSSYEDRYDLGDY